jgi:hypothetical protein
LVHFQHYQVRVYALDAKFTARLDCGIQHPNEAAAKSRLEAQVVVAVKKSHARQHDQRTCLIRRPILQCHGRADDVIHISVHRELRRYHDAKASSRK